MLHEKAIELILEGKGSTSSLWNCCLALKIFLLFSLCAWFLVYFVFIYFFNIVIFPFKPICTNLQTLTDSSMIQQTDTRTDVRLCDWFVSARSAQRRTSDCPLHTSANKLWSKGKTGSWVEGNAAQSGARLKNLLLQWTMTAKSLTFSSTSVTFLVLTLKNWTWIWCENFNQPCFSFFETQRKAELTQNKWRMTFPFIVLMCKLISVKHK